ncbi:hypothetical protein ABLE93_12200 [Xanthobacter sp. KR7-65]|uniref:hypothetical protein n=1 Tax=Xanthobacter sp. KR7-65 TaxID=3156612 RepID=UPI0032B56CEA
MANRKAPTNTLSGRWTAESSISSVLARGVADWAAAARADTMADRLKVTTASILEARTVSTGAMLSAAKVR